MKEDVNIDELLNSFIDGELTARQVTEVQRLIAHDAQIAQRLRELERCKLLVGSLPCAEAPAEMLDEVKASLERRTLFGRQVEHFDEQAGARHLLVRKVLAAAAMIGLVAGLAAVIYTIVGPASVTESPVAVEDWRPAGEAGVEEPGPSVVASAEKTIAERGVPLPATMSRERGFNGRLELKTNVLIAVDAFINRAIADNGLLDFVSSKAEEDKSVYALSCSREAVSLLLADLEYVWERFDSATLFVGTERIGGEVVVGAVTAEQIAEIVNQDSLKSRVKVAKDFAILNDMGKLLPGKEILAAMDDKGKALLTIPKPVLTSSERVVRKPVSQVKGEEQVYLTIVVVGRQ